MYMKHTYKFLHCKIYEIVINYVRISKILHWVTHENVQIYLLILNI